VQQALKANVMFLRDRDYVVKNDEVIMSTNTPAV